MLSLSEKTAFKAETIENKLILHIEKELEEIEISFAERGFYKVNLYNEAEIPAVPFHGKIVVPFSQQRMN